MDFIDGIGYIIYRIAYVIKLIYRLISLKPTIKELSKTRSFTEITHAVTSLRNLRVESEPS